MAIHQWYLQAYYATGTQTRDKDIQMEYLLKASHALPVEGWLKPSPFAVYTWI